jgi:hypothetical protein
MSEDWSSSETPGGTPAPAALAATQDPVPLRVALLEDERTPDGMVCMGTYRNDRLVARCALPLEAWAKVLEHGFFEQPVPVVLVAREAPPGLQCQLFAMVVLPEGLEVEGDDEDDEPWADSVPGAGYEAAVADSDDEEGEDEGDPRVAPIPLGTIVRFEAADVLRKVIEGKTSEVVDRALEDLLGGGGPGSGLE